MNREWQVKVKGGKSTLDLKMDVKVIRNRVVENWWVANRDVRLSKEQVKDGCRRSTIYTRSPGVCLLCICRTISSLPAIPRHRVVWGCPIYEWNYMCKHNILFRFGCDCFECDLGCLPGVLGSDHSPGTELPWLASICELSLVVLAHRCYRLKGSNVQYCSCSPSSWHGPCWHLGFPGL